VPVVLGTIASGGSATISLKLVLQSAPGILTNTASVVSSNPDTNAGNDSSSADVLVKPLPPIPAVSPLGLVLLTLLLGLLSALLRRRVLR